MRHQKKIRTSVRLLFAQEQYYCIGRIAEMLQEELTLSETLDGFDWSLADWLIR